MPEEEDRCDDLRPRVRKHSQCRSFDQPEAERDPADQESMKSICARDMNHVDDDQFFDGENPLACPWQFYTWLC